MKYTIRNLRFPAPAYITNQKDDGPCKWGGRDLSEAMLFDSVQEAVQVIAKRHEWAAKSGSNWITPDLTIVGVDLTDQPQLKEVEL